MSVESHGVFTDVVDSFEWHLRPITYSSLDWGRLDIGESFDFDLGKLSGMCKELGRWRWAFFISIAPLKDAGVVASGSNARAFLLVILPCNTRVERKKGYPLISHEITFQTNKLRI